MKPRKGTYLAHRWLGLLISLQLLAWSVGGFVFSVLDIRAVRGELDSTHSTEVQLDSEALALLPDPVRSAITQLAETSSIARLELLDRGLGPHWEARDTSGILLARFATDGTIAGPITPAAANTIAQRDFAHEARVIASNLIETDPPTEYRGRPLPAYRVELDHPKNPHIYVDASSGEITARRNRSWRVFDFFWMLHTMDYKGRDDFNHPLLTGASLLAIATSGTGLTLWAWRALPKRRRKNPAAIAAG